MPVQTRATRESFDSERIRVDQNVFTLVSYLMDRYQFLSCLRLQSLEADVASGSHTETGLSRTCSANIVFHSDRVCSGRTLLSLIYNQDLGFSPDVSFRITVLFNSLRCRCCDQTFIPAFGQFQLAISLAHVQSYHSHGILCPFDWFFGFPTLQK